LKDAERGRNEPHKDYIPELGGIRKFRATKPGTGEFGPIEQAFIELAEYERHSRKVMQRWEEERERLIEEEKLGNGEEDQEMTMDGGDFGEDTNPDSEMEKRSSKPDSEVEKGSPSKEGEKVEEPVKTNPFKEIEAPIPFKELGKQVDSSVGGDATIDPLAEFERLEGGSKEQSPTKEDPVPVESEATPDSPPKVDSLQKGAEPIEESPTKEDPVPEEVQATVGSPIIDTLFLEDGEEIEDPVQQQIAREMDMASMASSPAPQLEPAQPQSAVRQATPPPLLRKRSRSRLDVAASRRFVYNGLGLRVPKEDKKAEENAAESSALALLAKQALGVVAKSKEVVGFAIRSSPGGKTVIEDSASSQEQILTDMEVEPTTKTLQDASKDGTIVELDMVDKEHESAEEDTTLSPFLDIGVFGSDVEKPAEKANSTAFTDIQLIESDDDVPLLPRAGEVSHFGKWGTTRPKPSNKPTDRDVRRHKRTKSKESNPLPSELDAELFGSPGPTQETRVSQNSPKPESRANIRDIWREQRKKNKNKNALPSDLDAELFGSPGPTQESQPSQEVRAEHRAPKSPKEARPEQRSPKSPSKTGIFGSLRPLKWKTLTASDFHNEPSDNPKLTHKRSLFSTHKEKAAVEEGNDAMDLDLDDPPPLKEAFAEVQNISSDDDVEKLPHVGEPIGGMDGDDGDWDMMAEDEDEDEEGEPDEAEEEEEEDEGDGKSDKDDGGRVGGGSGVKLQKKPALFSGILKKGPVAPMARYDPVAQLEDEDSVNELGDGKYMMTAAGPSKYDRARDPRLKR
jgi:hypothetical protein